MGRRKMTNEKSFLERLSEKIAPPSKQLDQNADMYRSGLAGVVAQPYTGGISTEDMYRVKLAQEAIDSNTINNMVDKNRIYNETAKAAESELRNGGTVYPDQMQILREYKNNIDPGLAAKWMADREAFR